MKKDKENKIIKLTGLSLEEIGDLTEGQFTRKIWILYYKQILNYDQYIWLKGYRELVRKGKLIPSSSEQEVLDILGGELVL